MIVNLSLDIFLVQVRCLLMPVKFLSWLICPQAFVIINTFLRNVTLEGKFELHFLHCKGGCGEVSLLGQRLRCLLYPSVSHQYSGPCLMLHRRLYLEVWWWSQATTELCSKLSCDMESWGIIVSLESHSVSLLLLYHLRLNAGIPDGLSDIPQLSFWGDERLTDIKASIPPLATFSPTCHTDLTTRDSLQSSHF